MIVAMAVMGMVQTTVHQIANMIAMGDGFMAAAWAVDVVGIMAQIASACRRAPVRIGGAHL